MLSWMRKRLVAITAVSALAVSLYAVLGFWLAPRIVRSQAIAYVDRELGKSLSIGEIRFNPFNFRSEVRDIAIGDTDGSGARPLVSLKQAVVDFQLSSLWKGAWTFREVNLQEPYANAIVRSDGSLNLIELLPQRQEQERDRRLPAIAIGRLGVAGGAIDFADLSRPMEPAKRLAPIRFQLDDFQTSGAGSGFQFNAVGDAGERFDWTGEVSLQPFASSGKFALGGVQARTAYEFLSEQLPMELSSGRLSVAGQYRFSAGGASGTQLDATLPTVEATDLGLRDKGNQKDWVTLKSARLDNTRFSYGKRRVDIDALNIGGMDATVWMEKDGSINLLRWAGQGTPIAEPAPAAASASQDWAFQLGSIALEQASLDFEDRTVAPVARFRLSPLAVTANGLSLDMRKPLPVTVQATLNGKATLSLQGDLVPAPFATRLQVDLAGLPLQEVMAYLPSLPKLKLASGEVAGNGVLAISPEANPGPSLSFEGNGSLANFQLREAGNGRELVSWQRLDAEGIRYAQAPDAIGIQRIRAHKPYATVSVASDQSINLVTLFSESESAADVAATKPSAGSELPIKIARLDLLDATMAFSDYSIDPNFSARIESLDGSIRGLSTASDSVADIDLEGHVINRHSPVTIKGGTNLFAYDRHTDVRMTFRNIDLPVFNPYSGRFAGYAISKGKLTTELHYRIDERQLEAAHHVVIDQLEWGQATDSKDKVSLPIRLATSLLKNRHGVIDLDLPVNGSLDDPKFRIWPVVWQILKNIIVKIVSAPFDFLGSLFQGAEDAQFVDFAPGSAYLPEGAASNLAALAEGLADRPALRVEIPAGAAESDAGALAEASLQDALTASGKADAAALEALDVDDQIKRLERLYKEAMGRKPDIPKAEPSSTDLSRKERGAERDQADLSWLKSELLAHYQPSGAVVEELGRARANAIQDALLAGQALDPLRVFITAGKSPALQEGKVRVELALE